MALLENIRLFVRVHELGSISAAARDQRTSPAVASSRMPALEGHLKVRLFQRTTRSLRPTERGEAFAAGAREVIEAPEAAEGRVAAITSRPRGLLSVAAPLSLGRRLLTPRLPEFVDAYPEGSLRLRLTDRTVDLPGEGLDLSVFLGAPEEPAPSLMAAFERRIGADAAAERAEAEAEAGARVERVARLRLEAMEW
jgi:DNA-binding transcriptional LysR family regulator